MKQILLLIGVLILSSCATNKYHASDVTGSDISQMMYFEPMAYIYFVEKGNKALLNDSLSAITKTKVDSLLTNNKPKYRLSDKITISNDTLRQRLENEIAYLADQIQRRVYIDGIPLTPTIDSVLESNGQRFAMATVATGFGRIKGNYSGQVAKGLAVGILSMGMVMTNMKKSQFLMHAFIFDSEKNEIAFYRKSVAAEKEPTDTRIIEKQVNLLFEDYFYNDN